MSAIIGHANRGRFLEEAIQWANRAYRSQGLALIHKVPTHFVPLRGAPGTDGRRPLVGVKVDEKATVDFVGVYAGRPVAFDVKETRQHRWPLKNLEPHQAEFLADWSRLGGLAFVLIFFSAAGPAGRLYLVPWEELQERLSAWKAGTGPASIALEELQERPAIVQGRGVAFDYLVAVAELCHKVRCRRGRAPAALVKGG